MLEKIATGRIKNPHAKLHLAEITKHDDWMVEYEPVLTGVPKVWRLIRREVGGSGPTSMTEEVVLTVQGILANKDMPPFQSKVGHRSSHAQHLKQSVTLVGLETMAFQRAIDNVVELETHFGRSVGHQNMNETSAITFYRGMQALDISNRYFTPRGQAGRAQEIDIGRDIDPHGHLKRAAGDSLVHIEDNVVRYFEHVQGRGTTDKKFIPMKPIRFQIGDIVEAQVTVILVPQRDHKHKLNIILRSLTLMEGRFTQEAAKMLTRIRHTESDTKGSGQGLKRNIGYVEEEYGMARSKLSKLSVEDDVHDARKEDWD